MSKKAQGKAPAVERGLKARKAYPLGHNADKPTLIFALVCTAVLVGIHILFSTQAGPLWRDEVADVNFASFTSWVEIWKNLHLDNFPPFLLALLRGWIRLGLGSTDAGFRIFGCLVGCSLIGSLWLTARLCGRTIPLLGLVLFGLTPYTIWFGDAIRPYGLGIGMVLLAFGLTWKFTETGTPAWFWLAAASSILSVQALYQSAALILAMGTAGAVVCVCQGKRLRAFQILVIGGLAAISLIPYLPLIKKANAWSFVSRTGLPWERFSAIATEALSAGGVFTFAMWLLLVGSGMVYAAATSFKSRGNQATGKDSWVALYAGSALILSIVLFSLLLFYIGMPTQPWYYLTPMAMTAIALDAIFAGFLKGRPAAPWIFLVVALSIAGASLPATWEMAHIRQSNLDMIAAHLKRDAVKGDLILVDPWMYGIAFERYFREPIDWETIPPMPDHRIHRYDVFKEQMEKNHPLQSLLSRIAVTLSSGHSVWVVGSLQVPAENRAPLILPPAPNSPAGWSEGAYQLSWSQQIGDFLRRRARRGDRVEIPVTRRINPFENSDLIRVNGWQGPPDAR
jgi:hypothetical protein